MVSVLSHLSPTSDNTPMGPHQLGMLPRKKNSDSSTTYQRLLKGAGNPAHPDRFGQTEVIMVDQNSNRSPRSGEQQQTNDGHDIVIPAVRHVGPTLESDETTEGQELADAVTSLQDAHSGTSIYEPRPDSALPKDRNEPLRTRLPGDTSSEPHTDVGPDNATTVQHRGGGSSS
jgi:hypothetical protein